MTKQLATLSDKFINYVRNALDLMVGQTEDEFPVIGFAITTSGIATQKQLDKLEDNGHIKSIEVDAPSSLVPGKTVKQKAYYTERRVPSYVKA